MTMLSIEEAAEYLELPADYFRHQCKHGTGPACICPSERARFFRAEDLDAWRLTWRKYDQASKTAQSYSYENEVCSAEGDQ